MTRSPSLPTTEYDELSSPDPLVVVTSEPPVASSPSKPRRISRQKKPSSQPSRTSTSFCQQINLPTRTMTDQPTSPWNIRVTVEAEPELGPDQESSFITRTTRVPLRDCSPTPSRYADVVPSAMVKKSPPRSRRRSITPAGGTGRRQSVTDLDIVVLGDDADEDEWSAKRTSPRRRKTAARRRGKISSDVVDVCVTTSAEDYPATVLPSKSPELREIDVNKVSVRRRADSVKQPASDPPLPTTELPTSHEKGVRQVSTNSTRSYPTPSPTPSEQENVLDAFDTIMESEGFTMIDLDSIASVRQLRSSPANEGSAVEDAGSVLGEGSVQRLTTVVESSSSSSVAPEKQFLPGIIASSPPHRVGRVHAVSTHLQMPLQRLRQVTPTICSSPKLPSPPRASSIERSAPNSAETLKATHILQSALDPKHPKPICMTLPVKNQVHRRSSSDEIFEGFDSSTQREMRAGLRFGEELAKRQPNWSGREEVAVPEVVLRVENASHQTPSISRAPAYASSKSGSDDMYSVRPRREADSESASANQSSCRRDVINPSTSVIREQQWQLERDGVVRAIQQASPSKVIVIDSDEEEEITEELIVNPVAEDDTGDIWLAEAKDSSSSPRGQDLSSPRDQSRDVSQQPQRRPIPSPWKPGEQIHGSESTMLTNGEGESAISGLFWKSAQDDGVKFGAGQLRTIRHELEHTGISSDRARSGCFDLEKMMSPPKRLTKYMQDLEDSPDSYRDSDGSTNMSDRDALPDVGQTSPRVEDESLADQNSEVSADQRPAGIFEQSDRPNSSPTRIPSTPRSALKGTRPSLVDQELYNSDAEALARVPKTVVWARRSTHVDEDWIESSRSISTEDSSVTANMPQSDGPSEPSEALEGDWQATSKHISPSSSSLPDATEGDRANFRLKAIKKLPSYLRPPSYPSDPTRSVSKALKVTGNFSDTHFRTLHIIYRKAQRPRFHAPSYDELRPQIRKLVDERWTLNVDEDCAGLGEFRFKISELEGRVLERFCREVELGHIDDAEVRVKSLTGRNGIWGGVHGCDHGKGLVAWGWDCERLATWLGRIVIGEVVREEERPISKR